MNGLLVSSVKLNKNFTYATLIRVVDRVKEALDVPDVCPARSFAGVLIPVPADRDAVRKFKTCSFHVPLNSIPINWRCYCARRKNEVILSAGSELKISFVESAVPWTKEEMDKILLILLEINSEN